MFIGNNYTGTANALSGCLNDIGNATFLLLEKYNIINTIINGSTITINDKYVYNSIQSDGLLLNLEITYLYDTPFIMNYSKNGKTFTLLFNRNINNLTQDNMKRVFTSFIETINSMPVDFAYIHYSGHGSTVPDTNGDEITSTADSVWVPSDFNYGGVITDDYINLNLKKINKPLNVLVISDSCHSGTICDLPYLITPSITSFTSSELYKNATYIPKIICISGCRDDQTSADAQYVPSSYDVKKLNQGALTQSIISTINTPPTTTSNDVVVFLKSIRLNLTKNEYTQSPQLTTNFKNAETNNVFCDMNKFMFFS